LSFQFAMNPGYVKRQTSSRKRQTMYFYCLYVLIYVTLFADFTSMVEKSQVS